MLTAVLIDDEESSLNSLHQKLINNLPQIKIMAACSSAKEGVEAIERLRPDLVFLDIEMPIMNGFTLLKHVRFKAFEVIFVTAYDHYAIKAIKYSALDYLVKPVEIEELQHAVGRAIDRHSSMPNKRLELLLENMASVRLPYFKIAIPSMDSLLFVKITDIMYLEASGNYTAVHMNDGKKHLVSRTLKEYEEMLPDEIFIRIHNSFIINKNYVEKYIRGDGGQVILEGNISLDISKRRKSDFLRAIGIW